MIGDRNICTWIDTDILRCVATRVVQREEFSIFFYGTIWVCVVWKILDFAAQCNSEAPVAWSKWYDVIDAILDAKDL